MVILALDTTTPAGSCALARDGVVVREHAADAAAPPATRLPRELMELLDQSGIALADVDVFAVATGPGSFTGLRIGIATMQGLAFAGGKPLVGISGFEALARIGETQAAGCRIATWVDAWRGEVYAATYEDGREVDAPIVARPEDVLATFAPTAALFIGDGARAYEDTIRTTLGGRARVATTPVPLLAGTIACLAAEVAARRDYSPPHAIRPLYVRRTDAELTRDVRARG